MTSRKRSRSASKTIVKDNLLVQMRDQAQDYWMAGLGVIARAQDNSTRTLDKILADGSDFQLKAKAAFGAAKEKVLDQRFADFAQTITVNVGKLERLVESRTRQALSRAGLATKKDVDSLSRRVSKLGAEVEKLAKKPVAPRSSDSKLDAAIQA